MRRSSTQQLANHAMLDFLSPYFTPGERVIDEVRLTVPINTLTFAGLPQYYRTLVLRYSARSARVGLNDPLGWRVNGDAGANYDIVETWTTGAGVSGGASIFAVTVGRPGRIDAANARANRRSPGLCYWPQYAETGWERYSFAFYVAQVNLGAANAANYITSGGWRNTVNPITSLTILSASGSNLVAGSIFTLIGLL